MRVDNSQCTVPCSGNASDTCGGELTLDVYEGMAPKSRSMRARSPNADESQAERKEEPGDFLMAELL